MKEDVVRGGGLSELCDTVLEREMWFFGKIRSERKERGRGL